MNERTLTTEEAAILKELFKRKNDWSGPTHAYVTTTAPVTLRKWNGIHPCETNTTEAVIPSNVTLKIVMVSRFGDFGLTDNLNADHGYHIRLAFEDASITNIRWNP